jgi:hypothetical protein
VLTIKVVDQVLKNTTKTQGQTTLATHLADFEKGPAPGSTVSPMHFRKIQKFFNKSV